MSLTTEPPGAHEDQLESHPRVALRFEPAGTAFRVPPGVTVFDAASWNGIAIDSTCGGHGTCKKCRVRVVDGVSPATDLDAGAYAREELAAGWRLACRAVAQSDLTIEVPPLETRPKAATVGVGRQVILRPALQKRYVELDEPTLRDQRTDLERLSDAMHDLELRVAAGLLRRLPRVLRDSSFRVTAVVVDETLIDVEPGDTTDSLHAIAFDLGTTTVVATLLDLRDRNAGCRRLEAESPAALRCRRDLEDLGHDARRTRHWGDCASWHAKRCRSSPRRSARTPDSIRATCTRSRWPET